MLSIKSIYQILKDAKKSTKIAILLSLIFWLVTIVDKTILKGAINLYIHTPIWYIGVFFLQFAAIKQDWDIIKRLWKYIKENIQWKSILKLLLIFVPIVLAVLLKSKINEYLFNQNILGLQYALLQPLMVLKFLAKSLILFGGSFGVAIFSVFFLKLPRKDLKTENSKDHFLPILFILIAIFIAIKLYFILAYSGNYQDDWYHIVAGLNFFKDGSFDKVNQYFAGTGYQRGAYMTILTNFFMLIFGRSVDIAQLAPAFIGLVSFTTLLVLAKKVLTKNLYIIIFAVLYMTNPFLIFNHLFIRFYVFYELFFLLIILLLVALHSYLVKKAKLRSCITLVALIVLNILIWTYTVDKSAVIFAIYSLLGVVFCVLKLSHARDYLKRKLSLLLKNKFILFILLPTVLIVTIFIFKDSAIHLLKGIFLSSTNGGSNRNSLIRVICYTYAPLVLFTFLSFTQIAKKKAITQIILMLGFAGLVFHIAMPETYQVIRGFAYLWGILYLCSMIFIKDIIEHFNIASKKRFLYLGLLIVLPGSILLANVTSISKSFLTTGPNIQGEVAYYEFEEALTFAQTDLKGKTFVESTYNVIPETFYDRVPSYVLDLDHSLDKAYFPPSIKHVFSIDELKEIENKDDVCIIIRDFSFNNLVGREFMTYLINHYALIKTTVGYEIYCER